MKTIEGAAKDIAIHTDLDEFSFLKGVEFAQRWISVEKELPKNDDHILMKTKEDGVVFGKFKNIALILSVTHWRPIELK